jgi:hypothetical protein
MKATSKSVKVNRVGRKLAVRREKLKGKDAKAWGSKPLRRKEYRLQRRIMIGYDLETTRIKGNETPEPKYLTAFTEGWKCSLPIQSTAHLLEVLQARFLIPEFNRARFVAWNGNNFDVYLAALALLGSDEYTIRPYLTRSKNLRGLKVIAKTKAPDKKGRLRIQSWEFLDGISMTGLIGTPLKSKRDPITKEMKKGFLAQFAPEFDWQGGPDFEHGEEFNPKNAEHVRYAERDSEGLYIGMMKVEQIVADTFGMALQPTIGNLGIKLLQMNMPNDVTVWKPSYAAICAIRAQVMRGGYCFRQRRYDGALWKYDLNQAYAAAMREAKLPAGRAIWNPPVRWRPASDSKALNPYASVYIARCRGTLPGNKVPFYCRGMDGVPVFATEEIPETWLTSLSRLNSYAPKVREWKLSNPIFGMNNFP